MNKRGKDNNKWQGRYCIVQNSSFGYKIKKDDAVYKGILELADAQITLVVSGGRLYESSGSLVNIFSLVLRSRALLL